MHPSTLLLLADPRTKIFLSKMSAAELQAFDEHFYYVSDKEIETDVTCNLGSAIRRALSGRYRIFRKLQNDLHEWGDLDFDLYHVAGDLEQTPEIIAAALAIRPEDNWETAVVAAWSWVYRHAALLDINIADFADWCADQDPETSRAFVKGEEQRLYQKQMQPRASDASAAANGNA